MLLDQALKVAGIQAPLCAVSCVALKQGLWQLLFQHLWMRHAPLHYLSQPSMSGHGEQACRSYTAKTYLDTVIPQHGSCHVLQESNGLVCHDPEGHNILVLSLVYRHTAQGHCEQVCMPVRDLPHSQASRVNVVRIGFWEPELLPQVRLCRCQPAGGQPHGQRCHTVKAAHYLQMQYAKDCSCGGLNEQQHRQCWSALYALLL